MGQRWNVGHVTAWRRIQKTLNQGVDVGTLVVGTLPKRMPIILLDAKHFKIRKSPYTLYASLDAITSRPLAFILLPGSESRDGYDRILRLFRVKSFSIEAVVSDADQSIRSSVIEHYPSAVHQRCAFHVLKKTFTKLNGRRLIQTHHGRKLWKIIRKIVLEYDDPKKARKYFLKVRKRYPQHQKAWGIIERNLPSVYEFAKRDDLPIPHTSNRIENFMGRIEQRLKLFRTAKNATSLVRIIAEIIKFKYKKPTKR